MFTPANTAGGVNSLTDDFLALGGFVTPPTPEPSKATVEGGSVKPSISLHPSRRPTTAPPTRKPTRKPTAEPTRQPTAGPTAEPTAEPTVRAGRAAAPRTQASAPWPSCAPSHTPPSSSPPSSSMLRPTARCS